MLFKPCLKVLPTIISFFLAVVTSIISKKGVRCVRIDDVLIHDYVRVDYDDVWGIIERDLSTLKENIQMILQDLEAR